MGLFRGPDGKIVAVDPADAQHALDTGYVPVSTDEASPEITARANDQTGALGAVSAGLTSAASGATLGGSDWLLKGLLDKGDMQAVADARAAHPYVSTGGAIVGAIAPALVGDEAGLGALLDKTPAGFVTNIGSKVAERMGGGTAGALAMGSIEGAAQNTGSYLGDTALGDRDLSAEGFLGAMGNGALYGGVSAGALSMASHGLIAARRLLPFTEATPEAVAEVQSKAAQGIRDSVDTSGRLSRAAQAEVANTNREATQFLQDLEAERAQAMRGVGREPNGLREVPAESGPVGETQVSQTSSVTPEAAGDPASAAEPPKTWREFTTGKMGEYMKSEGGHAGAMKRLSKEWEEYKAGLADSPKPSAGRGNAKQLLKDWRSKYPEGAVDYDAANAAARRGRLAKWAEGFEPQTPEDEAIKAYFQHDQDPIRVLDENGRPMRVGLPEDVPAAVKRAANDAAGKAAHDAYIDTVPAAADVSESGTELMARSMYAARRSAARAMDDVYAAYKAGQPIADIAAATTKRLTGQLHELAESRADLLQSLAGKPAVADDLMSQLQGTKAALDAGAPLNAKPPTLGERILQGAQKPVDPDEAVQRALESSKGNNINDDIATIAPKITRYEAAKAQLTEALADKAPPDAVAHAQAFRQAADAAQTASARNAAQTTEAIDKLQRGIPAKSVPGGKPVIGKLESAATMYQALRSLGVPLPDPHDVPVIGPLLSMYLKAKLAARVLHGKGGSLGATAEGTIAAKAAATRNRIMRAVDTGLDVSARVTAKAAEVAGPMALSHKLFNDGTKQPYSSQPRGGSLVDNYNARMAELNAALKPGAIEDAVRSRIHTSDPTIVDSIVQAETRKAQYLYDKAPKPDGPPMPGQPPRPPSKVEIENWGVTVGAAHDPAAVYERVAAGGTARPDEIDCVQNCYPKLYSEAQIRYVQQMAKLKSPLPYPRRVAHSMLHGIPMDSTMIPDHMVYLQSGFHAPPPAPTPAAPSPTLASNITLGAQTMTRLDR